MTATALLEDTTRDSLAPERSVSVRFENITKVFSGRGKKDFTALHDVSLEVTEGEIFGIVGFSGAGKSTLLRTVNALERPTRGRVIVRGQEISALTGSDLYTARQNIGMIFQQFNLLASRTVYKNVAYPLALAKRPESEIIDRVGELLEFVGLTEKAFHYPAQLSGGQKQRVGIARALATSPDILICDEATSALDPQTTGEVLEILRRVNRDLGVTVLIVTHEIDVVREIAHRVAVMENGRVIEQGSVYDVFSDPQTETARRFVGSVLRHTPSPETLRGLWERRRGRLVQVHVTDAAAREPFVSRIARVSGADLAIAHGGVDELQGRSFGTFTLDVHGSSTQVDAAIAALREIGTVSEVTHARL